MKIFDKKHKIHKQYKITRQTIKFTCAEMNDVSRELAQV